MVEISCLQIDAFTDRPFSGNPAAVCLLEHERDSQWMQAVASGVMRTRDAGVGARPLDRRYRSMRRANRVSHPERRVELYASRRFN
jgi:hypothetical protein